MAEAAANKQDITGLVLAGGQGRRMGGQDKGLLPWQGRPIVAAVLANIAPQCGPVLISANRNLPRYTELGAPWQAQACPDTLAGFEGPLAGILAALAQCRTPWLAVAPCDSPGLPPDWVARLAAAAQAAHAPAAYAHDGAQGHYVVCLINRALHERLAQDMATGERRIGRWLQAVGGVPAPFPGQAHAFGNLNSPQDWQSRS